MGTLKDCKELVCIPTRRNEEGKPKIPLFKGWQLQIKGQHDGIGIVTGQPRLIVVDVDNKNETVEEFQKLFPNIWTPTARTISGGLHYYFKYDETIRTRTGLHGLNVDIRNERAFVVAPPTEGYIWIHHLHNVPLAEIPPELHDWITKADVSSERKQTREKEQKQISKYESTADTSYHISGNTTEKIRKSFDALPPDHRNHYTKWFKTTCAMKEIYDKCNQKEEIFKLWDDWSKTGEQYNNGNNTRIFHNIKSPRLNVNYIIKSAKEKFRMYPIKHYDFNLSGVRTQKTNNRDVTPQKTNSKPTRHFS